MRVENTLYGDGSIAYRRRVCDKCKAVIFTAETDISKNDFNVAMSYYYKKRRIQERGKNNAL